MTRANRIAIAYGLAAALIYAPTRAEALDQNEGVVLQGLDTFARDHISHLCAKLLRQGSLQPVYWVYTEPRLQKAARVLVPADVEASAVDRSSEMAKRLADRYAAILSKDANRLSAAHFRACHAPNDAMTSPPADLSVILVSRTETQEFGVFYHRLGGATDTDVISLSTDMSLAARALAQAWNVEWKEDSIDRSSSSWQPWLRGAVPGALISLGSSVPFLIAQRRVSELSADCPPSTRRELCDFDSRAHGIRTLDAWQTSMLWGGLGSSVTGSVLCGALDVCLWPEALWFGGGSREIAARSSTLRVSVDLTGIGVQGEF